MGIAQVPVSSGITTNDVRTANSTLTLKHSITSSQAVSIPADVTRVFAIVIGGGGGGAAGTVLDRNGGGGGGGGGVSYGWTVPSKYAFVGAGGAGGTTQGVGQIGNPSVYGSIVAGGGGGGLTGTANAANNIWVNVSNTPYFFTSSGTVTSNTSGQIPGTVLINNGALGGSNIAGSSAAGAGVAITNDVSSTSIRQYTFGWGEVTILPGSPNINNKNASAAYYGNSSGGNTEYIGWVAGGVGGDATYAAGGGAGGNANTGSSGVTGGNGGAGGATSFGTKTGGTGGTGVGASTGGGGGGGGAGALGNGSNGTNGISASGTGGTGGAGGSGGGGGGGGGAGFSNSAPGGAGGAGCVLIFY